MNDPLLQQLLKEINDMKTNMVTKTDLSLMATKDDLEHMATKSDPEGLATKHDLHYLTKKVDRNFEQIAKNTEHLKKLCVNHKRQEKIIETLSLRSIEHESDLRVLKQVEP